MTLSWSGPRSIGEGEQAKEFVDHVCGRDRGQFSMIVGRCDLDHIGSDDVESVKSAQDELQLPGRKAAGFGCAGAGRVRGVEHIDVDAHVDGPRSDALPYSIYGLVNSSFGDVDGGDGGETELFVIGDVTARVQGTANPDVCGRVELEDALLGGATERGAMGL